MEKKLLLGSTVLFSFLISVNTKWANIGLILLLVSSIYFFVKNKECFVTNNWKYYVKLSFRTTIFIFVLLLLGMLYTDDFNNSIKFIGRYSPYLIIPILFSFFPLSVLEDIKKISFKSFVIGTVFSSILLLVNNFYKYYVFKGEVLMFENDLLGYEFTYHKFASFLEFHPVFYGFYIVFALVIILEYKKMFNNVIKGVFIAILLLCLLFLNSRSPFLLLGLYVLLLVIRSLILFIRKREKGLNLLGIVLITIAIGIASNKFLSNTYLYERLTNQIVWELSDNRGTSYDGGYKNDSRMARWKSISKKGMERPIIGHGSGSEDRIALEAYRVDNLEYALKEAYGPHNQYLSFFIEYGVIGLALFIYFIGINSISFLRKGDYLFVFLFMIISIGSLFDSILNRNMTIIFFGFYANLGTVIYLKKREE